MQNRLRAILTTRSAALVESSIAAIFLASAILAGVDTYIVLVLGWLSLWLRGIGWKDVGLAKPSRPWSVVIAGLAIGAAWSFLDMFLVEPLIERIVGSRVQLSLLEGIRGNLANYLMMLAIVWLLVVFGEELTYRGYLLNRMADAFGPVPLGWTLALIAVSACFGLAHAYQGPAGIVATAYVALGLGVLYFAAGRNLWLPIVVHGSYDTVGITMIYLDRYPALRQAVG